eukprot:1147349-Pelagomonas_calceolata.AAC.2
MHPECAPSMRTECMRVHAGWAQLETCLWMRICGRACINVVLPTPCLDSHGLPEKHGCAAWAMLVAAMICLDGH